MKAKKFISIIASLTIACSAFSAMSANVNARVVDPGIGVAQPNYSNAENVNSTLSISGKTATCTSDAKGKSGVTKIVATQYLEKKWPNAWLPVETWKKTVNSKSLSMTNTKSDLSSATYRVKTVFNVYKGDTYETITDISDSSAVK